MTPQRRHYSFDLWMTLIKSNPQYKKERARLVHERFNPLKKTPQEIETVFRSVDHMANALNESGGLNLEAMQLYGMVLWHICDGRMAVDQVGLQELLEQMDMLVFDFIPLQFCSKTVEVIDRLHAGGHGISLLSNTGFIRGKVLRRVLDEIGLGKYFHFQLYSDEVSMSKPNPLLFKALIREVMNLDRSTTEANIIHVGDNAIADFQGARVAGIQGVLVNSNEICISSLLES